MSALDAFEAAAARWPEAPALLGPDGETLLAYRELRDEARRLASVLVDRGAGPERVVALACGRGVDHVVGLLAAWYAGAAFLPLDPSQPAERLRFVIEEAEAVAVVGRGVTRADAAGASRAPVPRLRDGQLAWVVYTSGSTGRPKGVLVEHGGVASMLAAQREAFDVTPGSRGLFFLSPAFDASISDLLTLLTGGGAVCVAPTRPDALADRARRCGLTHLDLPPALLPVLDPGTLPASVRTVVIGGEVCPPEAVRRWATGRRLVVVYGPTEATVCTSLVRADPATWDAPRIGEPLPGVRYERDEATGELVIAGAQVARGYLKRPQLTADRFPARGVFRTGDRVSRLASGEWCFAGRLDRQLKVRGMLVAPEEIEAALLAHADVRRAVVVPAGRGLAAWVATGPGVGEGGLRAWLADRLPAWMVPGRVVVRRTLPETVTGKPDRSALGAPPSPGVAARLAGLWEEVLECGPVGAHDGFGALGGTSIDALAVAALAEARGLALSPELLGPDATVEEVAGALAAATSEGVTVAELRAALPPAVAGGGPVAAAPPRHVLLTGATGSLGRALWPRLLDAPDLRVTCLVRGPGPGSDHPRLATVSGDVRAERLGLDPATWAELAETCDAVVHLAATVDMTACRERLWATNVSGTREVLRLAAAGRPKRLHHASTLAVFVATDRPAGTIWEADDPAEAGAVHGGYAQTKLAAELLLRGAAVPVALWRLGLLTGSARDHLALVREGLRRLRAVPARAADELAFDVTPVDRAAAVMARGIRSAGAVGAYHVCGDTPVPLAQLVAELEAAGVPLDRLDDDAWAARLEAVGAREAAPAWLAFCRALGAGPRQRGRDLFLSTGVRYDTRRADAFALG